MLAREVLVMVAALEGANAYYFEVNLGNTAQSTCDLADATACSTNPTNSDGEIVPLDTIKCGDSVSGDTSSEPEVGNGGLGFCGTSNGNKGHWYKFEDTTTCFDSVTFSLCTSTYDTKIQVWDDADCTGNQPACVAGNDDGCGTQSQVSLSGSTLNRRRYVWVNGFGSNGGSYTLEVTCNEV